MKNRDLIRDAMMFAVKDITGRVLREATVQSMIDDFEKQLTKYKIMDFKEKFKQDLINEDVHLSLTNEQRESIADLMDYQLLLYIDNYRKELLLAFAEYWNGCKNSLIEESNIDEFLKGK